MQGDWRTASLSILTPFMQDPGLTSATTSASAANPGSDLCLSCGLCCNGVLYSHLRLSPDEPSITSPPNLLPFLDDDGRGWSQPCPCYQGRECHIYDLRPRICRAYQCHVLQDYANGSLTLEEAMERIAEAQALVRSIEENLDAGQTAEPLWRRAADLIAEAHSASSPENGVEPALLMDLAALRVLLQKNFDSSAFQLAATE